MNFHLSNFKFKFQTCILFLWNVSYNKVRKAKKYRHRCRKQGNNGRVRLGFGQSAVFARVAMFRFGRLDVLRLGQLPGRVAVLVLARRRLPARQHQQQRQRQRQLPVVRRRKLAFVASQQAVRSVRQRQRRCCFGQRDAAGPPATGGQFAREATHAEHQRRLRRTARSHPHTTLRETAFKGK